MEYNTTNQNNQVFWLSNREKNVRHKKDCWLIHTGFLEEKKQNVVLVRHRVNERQKGIPVTNGGRNDELGLYFSQAEEALWSPEAASKILSSSANML